MKNEISTAHRLQLVQNLPSFLRIVDPGGALVRWLEADARACALHLAATNILIGAVEPDNATQIPLQYLLGEQIQNCPRVPGIVSKDGRQWRELTSRLGRGLARSEESPGLVVKGMRGRQR